MTLALLLADDFHLGKSTRSKALASLGAAMESRTRQSKRATQDPNLSDHTGYRHCSGES